MREEKEEKDGEVENVWVNDKTLNLIYLRGVVNSESKDLMWPLVHLALQNVSFKVAAVVEPLCCDVPLKRRFGKACPDEGKKVGQTCRFGSLWKRFCAQLL